MDSIKYHDLVKLGRLDPSTSQYVLKSGVISNTPPAGEKGKHRRFSLRQATRIAIATHLVMMGAKVKETPGVIEFCEKTVCGPALRRYKQKRMFNVSLSDPWLLVILDMRYAQIWNRQQSWFRESSTAYDLAEDKLIHGSDFLVEPITRIEINLTRLELEFSRSR